MILCSKLKKVLCKTVTKSQVVTKFNVTKFNVTRFNVTKSRLHCMEITLVIECHVLFTVFKCPKFESASVFHIRKSSMNRLFINAINILFGLIKIGNI